MAFLTRPSFALGWVPDADAVSAPPDSLLRMDNCVLDERGVVALRRGSSPRNSTAFADADVHSVFTGVVSGTTVRLAGAGSHFYINGTVTAEVLAGTGDVAFGSYLGQIFAARSTSRLKHDGHNLRQWGILPPTAAPTVVAVAPETFLLASCDTTESPAFTADEGTRAFVTGQDGTANGAIQLTPNTSTGRATITKTFATDLNCTVYASGAALTDDDTLDLYLYLTEPTSFDALTILVDVNRGTPFQTDYYVYEFTPETLQPLDVPDADFLAGTYTVQGTARRAIVANREPNRAHSSIRLDKQTGAGAWMKIAAKRGAFTRVGTTAGKDWTTVSAPSPYSAEVTFQSQSADVTIPADADRDPQATAAWLYRMGGNLDRFMRVATQAITGTGAITIRDTTRDVDALIADLPLEVDTARPPDNIIGIDGPYFDRVFTLTADGFVYPSRRRNPDSFGTGQAIRVCGPDETPYWIKKTIGGLYIGTSRDVYTLDGDGAELPDGSVNWTLRALSMDQPPVSAAVAQDGLLLVYVAHDGWRAISGTGSTNITGATSLLYRGRTRHDVAPVNLTGGRIRACFGQGQLMALTPEGSDSTGTATLYRYIVTEQRWERHTYPTTWRSIALEPDGTVIAGDNAGVVWVLDTGTGDGGTAIAPVVWTKVDDWGDPFHLKQATNLHAQMDSGGAVLHAAVHLDGASLPIATLRLTTDTMDLSLTDVTALPAARQVQLRITGGPSAFRLATLGWTYTALPATVKVWDSGPIDLGSSEQTWLRAARIKVRASAALTVAAYFDGRRFGSTTVTPGVLDETTIVTAWLPRQYHGRVPRLVITSTDAFAPFWVEFITRGSNTVTQKHVARIGAEAV